MPLKLSAPIIKDFPLEISDTLYGNDGEPTVVTIRQATQGAKERRGEVFAEVTRVLSQKNTDDDSMELKSMWSWEKLKRMEVYLTLVGCNILDKDGKDLFKCKKGRDDIPYLDMTVSQFTLAWNDLYPEIADEIHDKVLEVNPTWAGPLGS